jgi:hypothetical protein
MVPSAEFGANARVDTTCQGRLPQFELKAELGLGVPGKSKKVEWSREGWSIF